MSLGSTLAVERRAKKVIPPICMPASRPNEKLSPRQSELAALLAKGMRVKECARLMGISTAAAKIYCCQIYQRLGVAGRDELVFWDIRRKMGAWVRAYSHEMSGAALNELQEILRIGPVPDDRWLS